MPVDPYQPFTNRITGETFRCLASTEEAYITEWIVQPGGFVPFEHVHLTQDEVFHVLEGELQAVINRQAQVVSAGRSLTIPRGARQTARNNSQTEVLRCVLEYRPGLDSYGAFQCFGGLTLDESYGRSGVASPLKMMYLMRKMRTQSLARPAWIPTPLFLLLMEISYVFGSVAGWQKLYRKYVG